MIDLRNLKGKKIAIAGLGKSGMPVYEACKAAGIDTVLWDDDEQARKAAADAGARIAPLTPEELKACDYLCLAPGMPLTHPAPHDIVRAAAAAGVKIIGDIELFHLAKPDAKTICITGTNGKSTTTALIGHILSEAGMRAAVGGNIGTAVLSLPDLENGWYVLELSSFQIDLLDSFRPTIAVHVNLSPDHLDRHGTMEQYAAVKEKLMRGEGQAVIGIDDPDSAGILERVKKAGGRATTAVSVERPLTQGVFTSDEGVLFDAGQKILPLDHCPALKGQHNWQNAAIAYAAAKAAGVDAKAIAKALQTFGGLAHRQKVVGTKNNISYINDSKATNDQAASMALRTYNNIYWIAGGKGKGGGWPLCENYLSHVRHAFLIGAAEKDMAAWLEGCGISFTRCGTLETALNAAHGMAQMDAFDFGTVLLSPACASFDQFRSFEHRGEAFEALVHKLLNPKKSKAGAS